MQRNETVVAAMSAAAAAPAPAQEAALTAAKAALLLDGGASGGQSEHYPFVAVSESQYCTTKDAAAVKCSMDFTSGDLNALAASGQQLYLSFEATQLTQVRVQRGLWALAGGRAGRRCGCRQPASARPGADLSACVDATLPPSCLPLSTDCVCS